VLGIAVKIAHLILHLLWIAVMFLYWALSNYGRNFVLPAAWLVASVFIFHFGYALILAPLEQKVDPANKGYYDQAVCMLALGNAVPFVGHLSIDARIKKSLYCPDDVCGERAPIPPLGIQVMVIVQNVVSIALIFSSLSPCAIISRSSDGPKRPDFPQGHVARRKAAARSERAPPVTSSPGRVK
jgi:hypothetical protein